MHNAQYQRQALEIFLFFFIEVQNFIAEKKFSRVANNPSIEERQPKDVIAKAKQWNIIAI